MCGCRLPCNATPTPPWPRPSTFPRPQPSRTWRTSSGRHGGPGPKGSRCTAPAADPVRSYVCRARVEAPAESTSMAATRAAHWWRGCIMRSNDVAAEALQELADLIAISGGDPYRVRAYEKAARSVAGYPRDLGTLDRNGLIAIPAVGAHTADKLLELRQTGRIAALEDLHAQ